MLQIKDIKNLSEFKMTFVSNHKKESFFADMIKNRKIGKHHALFSRIKGKWISALMIIQILRTFPFTEQKNVYRLPCWLGFAIRTFSIEQYFLPTRRIRAVALKLQSKLHHVFLLHLCIKN